ncbi:DUF1402 family protein [Phyllobacterium zundukense]|uniref:DUF1402 domain-containing protein n=1 Tax=Phyllobacterium zundukense TaxID=1867719 RepID=A0A2N9VXA3_9HYPH|nr:DUF1402 family protein [Phyllobacterium zundukense]ATU93979.1 hypothetical protein BLM14_18825 [Phyllobacterium zundukense]PIO44121.1 hypothetical protein B5P45_14820 [Phyllobacterium zundukense]
MKRHLILFATSCFLLSALQPAAAVTVVPEGNRNESQPGVPAASAKRTREMNTTYEAKYQKIYNLLKTDSKLRSKIASVARTYGIDPVHIVGALVGEHTYNVDAYDRLQTYYVKAISYVQQGLSFDYQGETIGDFVKRPQFSACAQFKDSLRLWTCREDVWEQDFRGKTVGGKRFPDNRFSAVFFQPFYAGQSFGLGQLSPLIALQMTDMVSRYSGLPKLDADHAADVYKTIMDPDLTLPYMAAALKHSIDVYRRVADFDISGNPGITATLYNTGGPDGRARALADANAARLANGEEPLLPEENYYGWLVNEKIDQLRALF